MSRTACSAWLFPRRETCWLPAAATGASAYGTCLRSSSHQRRDEHDHHVPDEVADDRDREIVRQRRQQTPIETAAQRRSEEQRVQGRGVREGIENGPREDPEGDPEALHAEAR